MVATYMSTKYNTFAVMSRIIFQLHDYQRKGQKDLTQTLNATYSRFRGGRSAGARQARYCHKLSFLLTWLAARDGPRKRKQCPRGELLLRQAGGAMVAYCNAAVRCRDSLFLPLRSGPLGCVHHWLVHGRGCSDSLSLHLLGDPHRDLQKQPRRWDQLTRSAV